VICRFTNELQAERLLRVHVVDASPDRDTVGVDIDFAEMPGTS
jgi:hypothetical protein